MIHNRLTKSHGPKPTFRVFPSASCILLSLLCACSSIPEAERSDMRDPYENANRDIYSFNMKVDSYVLEPISDGYRSTIPDSGRRAVDNHLEWAGLPSTALNSTMQGELENAALATIHFAINSLTLGFSDLTESPGSVKKRDFGQTLASANVPAGHYLMVPLMGAHSSRNFAGRVVDSFTNPMSLIHAGKFGKTVRNAQIPVSAVAFRANNFERFNDVKYNSIDSYARTRSLYYQMRQTKVSEDQNYSPEAAENDDQFDVFFE